LTAAFDEDAFTPAWSTGSDSLYFFSQQGASVRIASIARTGGPVTLGADLHGETAGAPVASSRGRVAVRRSRWGEPPARAVADRVTATPRTVSRVNADAAECTFGATRTVRWTSSDGVHVEGVLVRPAGAPERTALKTLVLLHGGPYQSRYGIGFNAM